MITQIVLRYLFKGELIQRTEVGENFWCDKSKLKQLDIFPEMISLFDTNDDSKLEVLEFNRYQDGLKIENVTMFDYFSE